ncbi:MAG: 2-dehydropantoate 2-reductase [Tropicimonas sp.]|uniref:2-dehydropantoate 2-reductase n=1 Tax=Tropicimonas sp. TaxID=2067044 RepID=UPI003A86B57D
MKILIVGAGGVGGYFGGYLLKAGADVTFLVRGRRAEQLGHDGLVIRSAAGDLTIKAPPMVQIGELEDIYDVVLLSPKAYHLDTLIADLEARHLSKAHFVPVLNGLAHIDRFDRAFGRDRVLGGLARISATLTPEGVIQDLGEMHQIIIGARSPASEGIAEAFFKVLARSELETGLSKDITAEMWLKFVTLSTLAGATCLFRAPIGIINRTVAGGRIFADLLKEACHVAASAGYPIAPTEVEALLAQFSDRDSPLTASTLRDLEAGLPTEGRHIVGDMMYRGYGFGLAMPLYSLAYSHIQAAELRAGA